MGVAVRRSAVPRRPPNRQGVLRQSQETLDRSAEHGARVIHSLSLWNANVHARPGWKKRRCNAKRRCPLTAKSGHAAWQRDRLAAVFPKFNYYLLEAICLPMIESPETIRIRKVLRGSSRDHGKRVQSTPAG